MQNVSASLSTATQCIGDVITVTGRQRRPTPRRPNDLRLSRRTAWCASAKSATFPVANHASGSNNQIARAAGKRERRASIPASSIGPTRLQKPSEAGRTICVSEGERDVDNLWRLDLPATCNAHGASEPGKNPKWTAAHSAQLKGADIIILNDNDDPGYAHADAVSRLSHGVAKRVRRLDLKNNWPEIPKGGDVSD